MCGEVKDSLCRNLDKKDNHKKTTFMVWEPHSPRARGISESLDANIYIMKDNFQKKFHAPVQYVKLFVKTIAILKTDKPEIVICQVPPIFCALSALIYRNLMSQKTKIVIDMHTAAFHKPWSYFKILNNWVMKRAYLIIVTNEELRNENVPKEYREKTIILEDKIPNFQKTREKLYGHQRQTGRTNESNWRQSESSFKIAVICSFSDDEPLEEVINSAAAKPEITFYFTGNNSRANKDLFANKTPNVVFTGFLEYYDYLCLLAEVDAIIVLTTRDKTMLCGAYETLAVQKPLITSNFEPLRRYFSKGSIFVDNSRDEIEEAIQVVERSSQEMTKDVVDLWEERRKEWDEKLAHLKCILYAGN